MQDMLHKVLLGPEGLFESSKGSLAGKQRVDLLKAIEGERDWSALVKYIGFYKVTVALYQHTNHCTEHCVIL